MKQNIKYKILTNKLVEFLVKLLPEVLSFKFTVDNLLTNYFYKNKKIGKAERYIIAETIYLILRNYFKIVTVLESKPNDVINATKFTKNMYFDIIGIVWLKIIKIDNIFLKNITCIDFKKIESIIFFDDILSKSEVPKWIIDKLLNNYKENEIVELGLSMQQQAPLDLRVNLLKTDRKFVLDSLAKESFIAKPMPYSPFGIRLNDKLFLAKNELFNKGLIEVQDESSQLAVMLLAPRRGEIIVDFCAGSGGKALLMGMLMHNTGRVYAFDVNEKRLDNLIPRLSRSGLFNVYSQLIINENDNKLKRLWGKIDRVFVDAPCSGFGTLRRNPDLKFRQSQNDILELNIKQLSILTAASKLLKSGGHIVYATCSILYEENQAIVNKFLVENPDFSIIPAAKILSKINIKFIDENF